MAEIVPNEATEKEIYVLYSALEDDYMVAVARIINSISCV